MEPRLPLPPISCSCITLFRKYQNPVFRALEFRLYANPISETWKKGKKDKCNEILTVVDDTGFVSLNLHLCPGAIEIRWVAAYFSGL